MQVRLGRLFLCVTMNPLFLCITGRLLGGIGRFKQCTPEASADVSKVTTPCFGCSQNKSYHFGLGTRRGIGSHAHIEVRKLYMEIFIWRLQKHTYMRATYICDLIILRTTSHLYDTAALEHVDAFVAVHVEVLRRSWSHVVRHRVVAVDLVVRRHARQCINVVRESICAHTQRI